VSAVDTYQTRGWLNAIFGHGDQSTKLAGNAGRTAVEGRVELVGEPAAPARIMPITGIRTAKALIPLQLS
jgi:hypothetical protein